MIKTLFRERVGMLPDWFADFLKLLILDFLEFDACSQHVQTVLHWKAIENAEDHEFKGDVAVFTSCDH